MLRDRSGTLSVRVGLEGCLLGIGEGALEGEDDVEGPSSQVGAIVCVSPSSPCVWRLLRGRKVVELLIEAVDGGRSTFMAGQPMLASQ